MTHEEEAAKELAQFGIGQLGRERVDRAFARLAGYDARHPAIERLLDDLLVYVWPLINAEGLLTGEVVRPAVNEDRLAAYGDRIPIPEGTVVIVSVEPPTPDVTPVISSHIGGRFVMDHHDFATWDSLHHGADIWDDEAPKAEPHSTLDWRGFGF